MTGNIILDHATKSITIKNLIIKNDELFAFLEIHPDHEEAVRKALLVGALGIRSMGTGVQMDYVDKKFAEFLTSVDSKFREQHTNVQTLIKETFNENEPTSPMYKLARKLELYFGDEQGVVRKIMDSTLGTMTQSLDSCFSESGKVNEILDEHFDMGNTDSTINKFKAMLADNFNVDGGKIRQLLDASKEVSPLYQFKNDVITNITEIKERFLLTKQADEMKEKMVEKGYEFQDIVLQELHKICNNYLGDEVTDVSKVRGPLGDVGDFLVTSESSDKIVIEAKNSPNHSPNETIKEIRKAMENRKAKFGIFVFKTNEQIPDEIKPIKIDMNYIITSLEGNGLIYSYRLAKIFLESSRSNTGSIKTARIQEESKFIKDRINMIEQILNKTRLIKGHIENVESDIKGLYSEIDLSIIRIQNYLMNN